jgi:hypothetical protein
VTFDRYGHLFPGLDDRLREGLEDLFRDAEARPDDHDDSVIVWRR